MSTISHFIYEDGIEGFEETSEPRQIFGKVRGFDSYLFIDLSKLQSVRMEGDYLIIYTKNTDKLPKEFQIWGGIIIYFEMDEEGLCVKLEGGTKGTNDIIKGNYNVLN